MTMKSSFRPFTKAALALTALSLAFNAYAADIKLRVIETTDVHSYLTSFDYYKDQPTDRYGLTRAATLVDQARKEVQNSVLVDNGDLIQGSLIGEWANVTNLEPTHGIHPVYLAMNKMKYDVGNIGNHEFNFGLDYLKRALKGAAFPIVNSNVLDAKTGENVFTPYVIVDKKVVDTDGNEQTIKIGYIGFTPPGIMQWDAEKLTGKVTVMDIKEAGEKFVPEMKAKGADVIIAIPHSGIGGKSYIKLSANASAYLAAIPGVDAVMFGHSHAVFPSEEFKDYHGIDVNIERGLLNGTPAVMPGRWGDHIGIVDLVLSQKDGKWVVDRSQGKGFTRAIFDYKNRKALVEDNPEVVKALAEVHEGTRKYAAQPIGKIDQDLYGYLALTQDDPAVKLVNQAQLYALQQYAKSNPKFADYKLVSAAAPFKYGGRHNDVTNFTAVKKGDFKLRNTADVYVYPNTFNILEVTGKEVREWAECAGGMFNTIDPNSAKKQELLNYRWFRTYNFDVLYGVTYKYDVTKPAMFNSSCRERLNAEGRVVDLQYNGQAVKDDDKFLLATNNYRANGGYFPGSGSDKIAYASTDTNQQVVSHYIEQATKEKGSVTIDPTVNWMFKPITNANKDLQIQIFSTSIPEAVEWSLANTVWPLVKTDLDDAGFQNFNIDLTKYNGPAAPAVKEANNAPASKEEVATKAEAKADSKAPAVVVAPKAEEKAPASLDNEQPLLATVKSSNAVTDTKVDAHDDTIVVTTTVTTTTVIQTNRLLEVKLPK